MASATTCSVPGCEREGAQAMDGTYRCERHPWLALPMDTDEEAIRYPMTDPTRPTCWRDVVKTYNEGE